MPYGLKLKLTSISLFDDMFNLQYFGESDFLFFDKVNQIKITFLCLSESDCV